MELEKPMSDAHARLRMESRCQVFIRGWAWPHGAGTSDALTAHAHARTRDTGTGRGSTAWSLISPRWMRIIAAHVRVRKAGG